MIASMATRMKTPSAKTSARSRAVPLTPRAKNNAFSAALAPIDTTPEDFTFIKFLEGRRNTEMIFDPLSDEGLRLQAVYVQNFTQHPMDVLRRIMENIGADPKDRISAAKTLLEYTQRKPTQSLQVAAEGIGLTLPPSALANLSVKDLDALEKLLAKAQGTE